MVLLATFYGLMTNTCHKCEKTLSDIYLNSPTIFQTDQQTFLIITVHPLRIIRTVCVQPWIELRARCLSTSCRTL